ncbi:interleukin-17D [Trichomycterus rosablanca]|uniref:interleukin-17D n=1 Tax=Trichomycterus rosablanca TaxID=2290929 RepID=UPI002F35EFF7
MPGCGVVSVLLLLLVSSEARGQRGNRRRCADLPDEILEQRFGRLSVGVLSAFHHTLQLASETHNLSCPSGGRPQPDTRSHIPVNLLSLSPWAYRISHDAARYPRFIPEAYCLCKGCLTGPSGEESNEYRSAPVFVPMSVLRRSGSCVGGRLSYTESYESLPVGCTCVSVLKSERRTPSNNQTSKGAVAKSKRVKKPKN